MYMLFVRKIFNILIFQPKKKRDALFEEIRDMQSILINLKGKLTGSLTVSGKKSSADFQTTVYLLDYWTTMLLFKPIPCQ